MLEQSALHGRIYHSMLHDRTLASKPAMVADIRFGPMRPVIICRVSDAEMWVQDRNKGTWYHYKGMEGGGALRLDSCQDAFDASGMQAFPYYYGKALYQGETEQNYFMQNAPQVTYGGIPDISAMEMPLTVQALDYGQAFTYPKEVKALLRDVPACYVDRFKRPVKKVNGRIYPIAMAGVKTVWPDLPETTYPVVLDFSKTPYAVADLEPEHEEQDFALFNAMPGFYEEDTPRGGKHKIIRLVNDAYKFRYSKGLEIISQSQVTLYGINARWLCSAPEPIDMSGCRTVGHTEHDIAKTVLERPDVSREVGLLEQKAMENLSVAKMVAKHMYDKDTDISHGEFVALNTLYRQDIAPYAAQFERNLLPWIVEQYAKGVIEPRKKHETMRNGLPYLVYLAAVIIGNPACKPGNVWE